MRIGIRAAISALVLASIGVTAAGVNVLWWNTAEQTSQTLATTINEQIVSAVGDELQSITTEARSAYFGMQTLLEHDVFDPRNPDARKFAFLAQLQAQPTISWVVFAWPDGAFFAAHKLGDSGVEMMTIAGGQPKRRVDKYDVVVDGIRLADSRDEDTDYAVVDREWYRGSIDADFPHWFNLKAAPFGDRLAVAFAGPIDIHQQRQGVLGIIIELTRVSQFLSQLTVGKSAAAFILDRSGAPIASPDSEADEIKPQRLDHPLLPVAVDAIHQAGARYDSDQGKPYRSRVVRGNDAYQAVLTPISFPGWSLVTVVPEAEFLGPVHRTIRNLLMALAALIVGAGLLSAWLAQRLIATPLLKVVDEIKHVERFDLDKVERHRSNLAEISDLSGAIADMALGLAAFRKYIPADLVRYLIGEGTEARLGGAVRPMTVMFVDMAGFTGMSERLGDRIIPLLSRYFDMVSNEVQSYGGTIDKFIGDAVMAFWGAPKANAAHALDCCRAALACQLAIRASGLTDDAGNPLRIRIGINSGDMVVGNIGSQIRLNYTVIGDAVNIASRLEGTNKVYGSDIILGPETRRLAGDQIRVRELDRLAVYGRAGGLQIYELLGIADTASAGGGWVDVYERGLAAYRARDFGGAIESFRQTIDLRGGDQASALMIERCERLLAAPAGTSWNDTTIADMK
jgi:adenylate cyclase